MITQKPIALITGASAGIGAEFARVFATEGHDLILVARSSEKLENLAAELKQAHDTQCTVICCDLGEPGAPQTLFDRVQAAELQVDVLVNNAGLLHRGAFANTALADHLQLIQVNVAASTALAYLFLKVMQERGAGRILNVVSTSAFQPLPQLSSYAASKAFMLSLSEALWIETQGTGVTVTALCPGFVNTEMIAREGSKPMSLPFVRNLEANTVARQGFEACMAGKPMHINGRGNQAVIALGGLQPRPLQRWLARRIAQRGF